MRLDQVDKGLVRGDYALRNSAGDFSGGTKDQVLRTRFQLQEVPV
jgi:hypothetical protein